MPIFSRRRIQQMLDDLVGVISPSHFIGRLNDKRFENALPAEAELALVWAANRLGGFESEPLWFSPSGRKPEGVSSSLFPGQMTVFDVKALSDRVLPGMVGMRKISRKIMEAANKFAKGSGKNLSFFFQERRDYRNPKAHRTIYAPPDHRISDTALETLAAFLASKPQDGAHVDIMDGELIVRVTWKPGTFTLFNYRSSTVNEIFDIADNYIAAALREKARQLRSPTFTGLRGVLLCDIGSATLKRIDGIDPLGRSVSGRRIIQHYLDRPDSGLDFACVFSPRSERNFMSGSHYYWQVTAIVRSGLTLPMSGLKELAGQLPAPRFDGFELEHLHEQRLFGSQSRGWYLGCNMTTGGSTGDLTVKFSARALHEFLAGRIDADRLRDTLIGGSGPFEYQLARGNTIREARLIQGGLDEDDDYVELVFGLDPAASPFESRGTLRPEAGDGR
jgi:hypothetical protein